MVGMVKNGIQDGGWDFGQNRRDLLVDWIMRSERERGQAQL